MRVVAGRFRSRRLKSPRGSALRPTSDRLRETLFDILGQAVEGSVFIDVYAGTGAVGIEALSRGAREVIWIEDDPAGIELIRTNLRAVGVEPEAARARAAIPVARAARIEILATDAIRGLETLAKRRLHADFIFLDPPYAKKEEYERSLEFLDESRLLALTGRIVVEHERRYELPERFVHLERVRVVEQGDAALSFYRLALAA